MLKELRINLVIAIVLIAGLSVLSRLFFLQIIKGEEYRKEAKNQHNYTLEEEGKRGDVYFSTGELLAFTKEEPFVFVSSEEIADKEGTAEKLANVLSLSKNDLIDKMSVKGSYYEVVSKQATEEQAEEIKNLKLKGVYVDYKNKRSYPQEKVGSKIIGFVNENGEGQYGLEEYYNDILKAKKKIEEKQSNPWNFLFSFSDENLDGASITLTVDYGVQFEAEQLLEQGIETYKAEGGEIIVMEPGTGKIIAMAESPSFNPNNFQKENYALFQNSSIQKLFEPGSIFKPITMSAALKEKKVAPDTMFEDNVGYVQIGKYKVSNYSNRFYGKTTMTQVLEKSINTGMIFVERLLGHNLFYNYINDFGFFRKTGIDLAGEVYSENKEFKKALDQNIEVTFANAAFGQGIGMTPLQITTAFCAIINGGNLMKPYIVSEINRNNKIEKIEPEVIKKVIDEETSATIKNMLYSVIENGYGQAAQIDGYYVAGKTGTSQVPWTSLNINESGYSGHTWQSFIGFAPAFNPRFLIMIKLNNPATKTSEASSTPIFHDLAEYILNYWQVPIDYDKSLDKK